MLATVRNRGTAGGMNAWRGRVRGPLSSWCGASLPAWHQEQAAHSCEWVLKPILGSSSPAALAPQALTSTAPRNETQGMQGIVNKSMY